MTANSDYVFQRLPTHWQALPIKRAFSVRLGKMLQRESEGELDELVPYLKANHVQWSGVSLADLPLMWASPRETEEFGVAKGDLLVCEGGEVGRAAILSESPAHNCIIQNALHRIRGTNLGEIRFLKYVLETVARAEWFAVLCNRATIAHLTGDKLAALRVPLPPINDQHTIADFLDRETAKVDDLIAKKQELMVLLQNQKEAVVGQLVVGHDLNVPKQRSGYSWLGEIPYDWKVLALKRIAKRVVVGIAEASTHAYSDNGIPLIRSANIRPNRLDSQQLLKIEPWFADKNKSKTVLGDDLLTVRSGVNYGDTAVVPTSLAGSQCFTLLITTLKPGNAPQYFSYYLNSMINRGYFEREAWGAAQANLSVPILQMTPVPVPPPSEQARIVHELDQRLREIERLRASLGETERQLQLLRSALISAAVTGQVDVRTYRPQEAVVLCP